jgi:hypothetical protein
MPRDGDPMSHFAFKSVLLDDQGVKATVYRSGARRLVAFSAVPWTPARPANPAEAIRSVLEATFGEGAGTAAPIGTRDRTVVKIGRRKRRIYRVAAVDLEADDCWLDEVGWYVDTLRPPASWMNNDPFGPYATLDDCLEDSYLAYLDEES